MNVDSVWIFVIMAALMVMFGLCRGRAVLVLMPMACTAHARSVDSHLAMTTAADIAHVMRLFVGGGDRDRGRATARSTS